MSKVLIIQADSNCDDSIQYRVDCVAIPITDSFVFNLKSYLDSVNRLNDEHDLISMTVSVRVNFYEGDIEADDFYVVEEEELQFVPAEEVNKRKYDEISANPDEDATQLYEKISLFHDQIAQITSDGRISFTSANRFPIVYYTQSVLISELLEKISTTVAN